MPSLAQQRRIERQHGTGAKALRPVRPSAAIEAQYRARLTAMVTAMSKSVEYWLTAAYRANNPAMAQDIAPADILNRVVKQLSKRWIVKFDDLSDSLAEYFATSIQKRSDAMLKKAMRDAGFTVEFKLTPAQSDVLKATVNQNVSLIRSIPEQYFTQIEGLVQRSVQTGHDMGTLSKALQEQYGVTKRRAALIARSQNSMATASMTRARQEELGITEAIWRHSHGGKVPRPTHVKMDDTKYPVSEGLYDADEGRNIWPGELLNCRCVSSSVVKGFS